MYFFHSVSVRGKMPLNQSCWTEKCVGEAGRLWKQPPTPLLHTKPVRNSKKKKKLSISSASARSLLPSQNPHVLKVKNHKGASCWSLHPPVPDKSQVEKLRRATHRRRVTSSSKMVAFCAAFLFIIRNVPAATSRLWLRAQTGSVVSGPVFLAASWLHLIRGRVRSLKCVVRAPSCQTFWRVRLIAHRLPGLFVWCISNKLEEA